jgi:hypothetical protein
LVPILRTSQHWTWPRMSSLISCAPATHLMYSHCPNMFAICACFCTYPFSPNVLLWVQWIHYQNCGLLSIVTCHTHWLPYPKESFVKIVKWTFVKISSSHVENHHNYHRLLCSEYFHYSCDNIIIDHEIFNNFKF